MTYFLCAAVGIPALVIGAIFQDGPIFVLGWIAIGMAAIGAAARHEWHLYRDQRVIAHKPLQGQMRIGLAIYDPQNDRAKDVQP